MMEVLVILILLGGCFLVAWLLCSAINAIFEHKELKKRRDHPQFYGWIAELNEMVAKEVSYHNKEIAPLKREIDRLIAEQPYLTAERKVQTLNALEDYREILADRQYELKRMEFESAKLRNRIKEYNKEHNLESGWND